MDDGDTVTYMYVPKGWTSPSPAGEFDNDVNFHRFTQWDKDGKPIESEAEPSDPDDPIYETYHGSFGTKRV